MPVGIIPKLTKRKPFGPLVRMSTDETPQKTLHLPINTLSLPISLRMIGCAHIKYSSCPLHQSLPEFACENWVSVRYYIEGHTMKLVNIVQKEFRNFPGCIGMFDRYEMTILCKFVNDHHDAIILIRRWQSLDEIHCHCFPGFCRNRQW